MTQRVRPAVTRTPRPSWERRDRTNFFMNIGFGLVVIVAVLILIAYAAISWYDAHLAPVATVNGASISKDDFNRRFQIESYRLSVAERRLNDEFNAGRITKDEQTAQLQSLNQFRQQIATITLERLIDAKVGDALAPQEGVSVSPAQIDAQITKEETLPEQRHIWAIEVAPKADNGAEPTAAAKADAKKKADAALADLNAGKKWEDVAKATSTASSAASGGDAGWQAKDSNLDKPFAEALFGLQSGAHTGVVEGEDGTYRIGRVTEIAAQSIDPLYREGLSTNGLSMDTYRDVVRADLVRDGLKAKVDTAALAPSVQREVKDIFIRAPQGSEIPSGSVKTRHILIAPNDNASGAKDLKADDPAWKKAEDEAKAEYEKVKKDPSLFDAEARAHSDEPGAKTSGGKLPYFDPTMSAEGGSLDPAFGSAIFKQGLKPGDILPPVKSAFGWHVIQIMYFPPDLDQAKKLKAQLDAGADFGQVARDYSDGTDAAKGGDLGWVARLQLTKEEEDAIFAAPVGKISDPIEIAGDGIHIYEVVKEETRTPDAAQKTALEQQAFSRWYAEKKATFKIERKVDFSGAG